MTQKLDYYLHSGPDSCYEEWLSYFRSHKREVLYAAFELLLDSNRLEPKIFCLNSGNCGSKYLVHLLKANGIDYCYHEKAPDLDRTGVRYFLTGEHEYAIKALLLLTRDQVYLESNNRLFSLAPVLKDVFSNSKFIHLHRNGIDSVRSIVNKILWPDVMERATRLRYASRLAGEPTLDPFERTCHYWTNINCRILDDLNSLPDTDVLSLRFNNLVSGNVSSLESFLGNSFEIDQIEPVNTKDEIKTDEKKIDEFSSWPTSYQRDFRRICGTVQRRLGYEVPS